MTAIADEITTRLQPLVGLKLSIARRAADLRAFHFGQIRKIAKGTSGECALHIQCPWRLEGPHGIITGWSDLWEPAEHVPDMDWGAWDYQQSKNLQDNQVGELLGSYDPQTRSFINETDQLVVEAVRGDAYGGATLVLSGGFRLVIFPAGTRGEDWRIFRPEVDVPHFMIAGGRIETDT